jgi:serine/threonine-protein kinase
MRYRIYSEFASGSMGRVCFGKLRGAFGFQRTVAIKRLRREGLGDPGAIAMLIDEARITARIHHPNVVAVRDVVVTDNEILIVMEYVHGESLLALIRAGPVPRAIAARILSDVLRGLHAAHEATDRRGESLEIVHRDVSPSNVLVGVDGIARIGDFGIAKAVGKLHETRTGHIKGKLTYMPPEQLCGETLDRRADVYAAGIVLWETLSGMFLFADSSPEEMLDRKLRGEVPAPSEMDRDLAPFDAIAIRAMKSESHERFSTAREMAIALERCTELAAPSAVGAWVEATASGALSERARRLEDAEAEGAGEERQRARRMASAGLPVGLLVVLLVGAAAVMAGSGRQGAGGVSAPSAEPKPVGSVTAMPAEPLTGVPPTAVAIPVRRSPRRPASSTSGPSRPACEMPFVVDSEGRRHYKRECMP